MEDQYEGARIQKEEASDWYLLWPQRGHAPRAMAFCSSEFARANAIML